MNDYLSEPLKVEVLQQMLQKRLAPLSEKAT